jgi:hypothetical protein
MSSNQPCIKPYKRHLYRGQLACERCGCPNPNWKANGARYAKVMVLLRPARRPHWWPKGTDGRAAWATLNFSCEGVWGFTIGRYPDRAASPRCVWDAINEWEDDNDNRFWDFRVEKVGRNRAA